MGFWANIGQGWRPKLWAGAVSESRIEHFDPKCFLLRLHNVSYFLKSTRLPTRSYIAPNRPLAARLFEFKPMNATSRAAGVRGVRFFS